MMELSGLPKTSLHRMVGSLEEMGFLTRDDGDGYYSLGLIFLQFGQLVGERLDIPTNCISHYVKNFEMMLKKL